MTKYKDYWSKEKRREYMRNYNATRNPKKCDPKEDMIGPPVPHRCDCGQDWGFNIRGGDWICHRCKALESVNFHTNENRQDSAIIRNISPAWLLRQLQPYQRRLKAWIDDTGNELIIHAHGEYHLQLTP